MPSAEAAGIFDFLGHWLGAGLMRNKKGIPPEGFLFYLFVMLPVCPAPGGGACLLAK